MSASTYSYVIFKNLLTGKSWKMCKLFPWIKEYIYNQTLGESAFSRTIPKL